jgi:ADP-ribosylglycohydrolase
MNSKLKAMVLGAFVGDALALGPHWVYNTNVIDKKYGRVEHYLDPLASYHKGKKAGDFTHYGDQMLVLLESVGNEGGFEAQRFAADWQTLFEDYTGYFDHATKDTLANLSEGKDIDSMGSESTDLAGAARIAPLIYCYVSDPEKLVTAARHQTAMTHNNATVLDGAEFFARTAVKILDGDTPVKALSAVRDTYFKGHVLEEQITAGLESRDQESRQAVADFGQMCSVDAALPASIHLIARHEDDFKAALVENVMAGGDSAARGMLVGTILGAHHGLDAFPPKWLEELAARDRINVVLTGLDTANG